MSWNYEYELSSVDSFIVSMYFGGFKIWRGINLVCIVYVLFIWIHEETFGSILFYIRIFYFEHFKSTCTFSSLFKYVHI